ncbi:MAG TPA: peptide deformylase [Rectinemataceae bacterium]|nr:peptide deformylase [Rectinemataceae bacterium]
MRHEIRLLGDPLLRLIAADVEDLASPGHRRDVAALKEALDDFRAEKGFGRGIAAPQIGISRKIVALNLGSGTFVVINPKITRYGDAKFTMWDDCMSFPDLLVRLERSSTVDVEFLDEGGHKVEWKGLGRAESELLQHEIDHLHGILAVDRALDRESLVYRSLFAERREYFEGLVDYRIEPTI